MLDNLNAREGVTAGLVARPMVGDVLNPVGLFTVECFDQDGHLKWSDEFYNLVTTEGKNAMLDKFLGLGAAYAGVAMGLHTTIGNAASTYATPSPQVEVGSGVVAARATPSFSAASAGSKATSAAVAFSVIGSATITGCFVVLGATGILTNGNTAVAAILLSTGAFSGGSRAVISGDTLNVTYSLAL